MADKLQWIYQEFPELSNLAPLALGGQRLVFSGSHTSHGQVVFKVIFPWGNPARPDREILAAESVEYPRIPRIFDKGNLATPLGSVFGFLKNVFRGKTSLIYSKIGRSMNRK